MIFSQILFQFVTFNFLILILSASPNMMHFVRTFSIMSAYGVRLIAIEEAQNFGKIAYIKNIFENGRWDDAYTPHFTLLDPPLAISYTKKKSGGHGTMSS